MKTSVSTGTPWEAAYGYRRAVRHGPFVCVAGTTSTGGDGTVLDPDDAHAQARRCFASIEAALAARGASLSDVVRTRMYVVDVARDSDAVGRAHGEAFGALVHPPAATLVEVRALIDSAMRVEIEAEAFVAP